ncbi:hypothetical protein HY04AAS1_1124 [Hydrogenobaculum sp. Y04AAS1]|nr:hypothetical protein HY04AAS1_1124 [Hydrogenobaculum sp. Y04AAS1]
MKWKEIILEGCTNEPEFFRNKSILGRECNVLVNQAWKP